MGLGRKPSINSAMMIASEIGDITRFSTPEKLVSWSGLCPSIHQSGNSTWEANTAARKDERLRKFYLRIAKRHGHHIAITHVANKMITIIWHMLVNRKLYNERKQSLYETKLKRIQKT